MDVKTFVDSLNSLRAQLNDIEPDPKRAWKPGETRGVIELARGQVLGRLEEAVELIRQDDPESAENVKTAALSMVADAAGLAIASGDVESGRRLLKDARQVSGLSGPLSAELSGGHDAPQAFALLNHGRWLIGRGKSFRGERQMKAALKLAGSGALKPIIVEAMTGPRPIKTMPSLSTFNGIGGMLFGSRDKWPDGSYIATHFICVLFVPLIPLAAYRVRHNGDGSYQVFARYPLGRVARGWLATLGVGAALLAISISAAIYLDSPSVKHGRDLAALEEQLEIANDSDKIAALQEFLTSHPSSSESKALASQLVSLTTGSVKRPLTADRVKEAMDALNVIKAMPAAPRKMIAPTVSEQALGWLEDLKDIDDNVLLALARRASSATEPNHQPLRAKVAEIELNLALKEADEWPAATIARLASIAGEQAKALRVKLLASTPSVGAIAAIEHHARAFASGTGNDEERAVVAELLKQYDERKTVQRDEKWLEKNPDDQELAAKVALDALAAGKVEVAKRIIERAAPRGWWGVDLLVVGSEVALERSDLAEADVLLDRALAEQLPEYTKVATAFMAASERLEKQLIAQANAGTLPADVMSKLRSASDEEQGSIFSDLFRQRAASDKSLVALRAQYEELASVVGVVLRAATVKLRRAATAPDEAEQQRLLNAAEQLFLTIQAAAGDDPTYQLGLGEVKYRVNKPDDGQRLLDAAAARDPQLAIQVSSVYRNVGAYERARATAKKVFDDHAKGTPHHMSAASMLAHLSTDLDEELAYLEDANHNDETVRAQLAEARAKKLIKEGKEKEADVELAKAAAIHEKNAGFNDAAANNAAVAYLGRYSITGDIAHVRKARALFDKAMRLSPSSQIVIGNLSAMITHESILEILSGSFDLAALKLSPSEAASLGYVAKEKQMKELRASPKLERLAEQQRVLAPTTPQAWRNVLDVYAARKDVAALERLEKALATVTLDTSDEQKAYAARSSEQAHASAVTRLARMDTLKGTTPATRAALEFLRSGALMTKATASMDEATMLEAISALERAEQNFPADLRDNRSALLVSLGVVRAAKAGALMDSDVDALKTIGLSHLPLALAAGRFPDARAALAARPEWKEALALMVAAYDGEPSASLWALAHVIGDDARAAKERDALRAATWKQASARIGVLLAPYSDEAKDVAAVMKQ